MNYPQNYRKESFEIYSETPLYPIGLAAVNGFSIKSYAEYVHSAQMVSIIIRPAKLLGFGMNIPSTLIASWLIYGEREAFVRLLKQDT